MAAVASSSGAGPAAPEVTLWLRSLPSAPEFHPTPQEFQDPIAYILKIEKEAAPFGICKIVPPLPPAPKKTVLANFNRSFAARNPPPAGKKQPPTFTTRQQQIGFCPRRPRPVLKHVWQSGEQYSLQQFEAKARQFERSHLRRGSVGRKGAAPPALSSLEIETLFWRASADKPFTVEYANDMPGSGFAPLPATGQSCSREDSPVNVGESAWNMRGVSRAKGSLLRLMKEEIPGVTSPMVYVAMLFSWFAWHVEDHELHSLNYLHMGSGKTWYGVPRDAGLAFEEVVRVHGYGGELNPLMTFAILGEKTTVMSPEVLVGAGIPCCRLVQNAGDFVVTFPGAYHMGFSHGFNCGEAANIATPEWLRFAKEAAVRRASINYLPMVSHYQLLYALALSLHTRMPIGCGSEPRSSRLKRKMKGEGGEMIKNAFVQNVIQNNDLLSRLLDKGTCCVVLPPSSPESPSCPNLLSQWKIKPRLPLGLCSRQEALEASQLSSSIDVGPGWNAAIREFTGLFSFDRKSTLIENARTSSSGTYGRFVTGYLSSFSSNLQNVEGEKECPIQGDGLLDQGLLSCVTCGILSFSCVAVIQPKEATAKHFMSADCGFFCHPAITSGEDSDIDTDTYRKTYINKHIISTAQVSDQSAEMISNVACPAATSALDLLASVYADLSDADEEVAPHENFNCSGKNDSTDHSLLNNSKKYSGSTVDPQILCSSGVVHEENSLDLAAADKKNRMSAQNSQSVVCSDNLDGDNNDVTDDKSQIRLLSSSPNLPENGSVVETSGLENNGGIETSGTTNKFEEPKDAHHMEQDGKPPNFENAELCSVNFKGNATSVMADLPVNHAFCIDPSVPPKTTGICSEPRNVDTKMVSSTFSVMQGSDKNSSRMHVFCLEHAAEVEKQLQQKGGIHLMLLCHPDYPKIESEAKLMAEELGNDYIWKNIKFREANEEDLERIKAALEDEEVIPTNSDWTVKLGINLYYTANLSKSPLYSKQMPYNPVIYKAFGRNSAGNSPEKPKASRKPTGRHKKIVVAGRWCGRVWMTNQVHPFLAHKRVTEQEQLEEHYSVEADQNSSDEIEVDDSCKIPSKKNSSGTMKKRKKPLGKAKSKRLRYTTVADDNSKAGDGSKTSGSTTVAKTPKGARTKHNESKSQGKSSSKDEAGGPSSRLRKRPSKSEEQKDKLASKKQSKKRKTKNNQNASLAVKDDEEYTCDIEGCAMSFSTKQDLALHKRDICPVKGCGKKFFSHKYLVQHRKVHMDDRPLVCPWKGCKMTFKWPWARTEHIRVHTGDRPYVCREPGCGQTFRFVSDFSRHKRKTGHSAKKGRR